MTSNMYIVIEREYLQRVKKKSFIFTTILMPLIMLLLMAMPALIMYFAGNETTNVLVIDNATGIADQLQSDDDVRFQLAAADTPLDSATARKGVDAVLVIPADIITNRKANVKLYSDGPSSLTTEHNITEQLNSLIEKQRLLGYNIANLPEIMKEVESNVQLSTVRLDKDSEEATSTMLSYGLGLGMAFILYMFLMIYGQMVMTSIIDEKSNRVLEVLVSSVRPMDLMMGKILGIAFVAITQILIWGILLALMSAYILPMLIPADVMTQVQAMQAGSAITSGDTDVIAALSVLTQAGNIISMIGLMTLFLVFGFLLFAAIFAAIGSTVDNVNDASQLTSIAVFPIVFGLIFASLAANDPSSPIAFWTSMIPLTSPMVMVARIPFGIPAWEIALSLVLLIAGFIGLVWCAGRIYRVGIFMYGKKPTPKELLKWITYRTPSGPKE